MEVKEFKEFSIKTGELAKYAIIRNYVTSLAGNVISNQRPNIINPTISIDLYSGNYRDFNPFNDTLIKDVEVIKDEDGYVTIIGTKIEHGFNFNKHYYTIKWDLFDEFPFKKEKNRRITIDEIIEYERTISKGKINLKPEDIKFGSIGFWNKIKGKKCFYVENNKEVISHYMQIGIEDLHEEDGRIYSNQGWYTYLFTSPFKLKTGNHLIKRY